MSDLIVRGWWLPLSGNVPYLDVGWLQPSELLLSRRQSPQRRREFLLGRALLRAGLSAMSPDTQPEKWSLSQDGNLATGHNDSHLTYNVSHSRHHLCCVVAQNLSHIGIDIEQPRTGRNLQRIADNFFTTGEAAEIERMDDTDKERRFYALWTAKESYLKAIGLGLPGGLNRLYAVNTDHAFPKFLKTDNSDHYWWLRGYWGDSLYLSVTTATTQYLGKSPQIQWQSGSELLGLSECQTTPVPHFFRSDENSFCGPIR